MSKQNGGSAFPASVAVGPADDKYSSFDIDPGMSLRDWFAGQALNGLMANPERYEYLAERISAGTLSQDQATEKNVKKAYLIADAMIAERDNSQSLQAEMLETLEYIERNFTGPLPDKWGDLQTAIEYALPVIAKAKGDS